MSKRIVKKLGLGVALALLCSAPAMAKGDTVVDYARRVLGKTMSDQEWQSALQHATVHLANGYIHFDKGAKISEVTVALFHKSDGTDLVAVSSDHLDANGNSSLKFYVRKGESMVGVTDKVAPEKIDSGFTYVLPDVGTTISVRSERDSVRKWVWDGAKFSVSRQGWVDDPTLAGISVDQPGSMAIVNRLGPGWVGDKRPLPTHVYTNRAHSATLVVSEFDGRANGVTLLRGLYKGFRAGEKVPASMEVAASLEKLASGLGVALGDSVDKVRRLYGKPRAEIGGKETDIAGVKGTVLEYSMPHNSAGGNTYRFCIVEGKVAAMELVGGDP